MGWYAGATFCSSSKLMPVGLSMSVNMSSTLSHGHASGFQRLPSSRLICMSDLHSPTWVTLLIVDPRWAPDTNAMPLRSQNVWAGRTTSARVAMVGVLNRSTTTMKSSLLSALYRRCGSAPMLASGLVVCSHAPWIS